MSPQPSPDDPGAPTFPQRTDRETGDSLGAEISAVRWEILGASANTPQTGEVFRAVLHYQIQEKLGEGGMGVVYKALDRKLNRFVALKFLPSELADRSANLDRFVQEAIALSAVNHPNIATIYDVASVGQQQFLVLEYLPGGTLKAKVERLSSTGETLTITQILNYARQTAEGLAHAHARGIVHRDIKTSNLMLTEEGSVKITDFGVAKLAGSRFRTVPGSLVGTIAYMSPEQAQGRDVDARSDIFSFGVVLFELITGRLPFEADNDAALLTKIASSPIPKLRERRADVAVGLERIVERALKRDPQERYQRMEELLRDLETIQDPTSVQTLVRTETERNSGPHPTRRVWLGGAAPAALVFALVLVLAFNPSLRNRLAGTERIPEARQLAVLPLRNVGGDPVNGALSDGLMEILTNKLTQLEQLQGSLTVVSASEVLKEHVTGAKEARAAFGANLIIDGSVQRSGDRVLVTANLVDTKKQTVLAASNVEARVEQLSLLQESLVEKVAEMLQLQLRPDAKRALVAGLTVVPGAYEFYLQGRGYLQRFDRSEDLESAIAVFDQALARDPSYALAHAGKAEAYLRKYQLTKDARFLANGRESGVTAIQLNDQLAPVHFTMGLIHYAGAAYQQAIESFDKSIDIQPGPDAYRELAKAYDASNRQAEAEATYLKAIQLRPSYWAGYKDLGVFYTKHGRFAEALPHLQKVVQLTPDNYDGYANLGGVYLKLKMHPDAIAKTQQSLSMKPSFKAYNNLGAIYYVERRYREASEMFKKATEINPKDARTWGALGDAYRWTPQLTRLAAEAHRQAIELGEQELAVKPADAQLRANIASWSVAADPEKALREIREALRLNPQDGRVQSLAAAVYEQTGRRNEALAAFQAAIKLGYATEEMENWPPLEKLREDPRYKRIVANKSNERSSVPITSK